jgi:predicted Zn-dependent protease
MNEFLFHDNSGYANASESCVSTHIDRYIPIYLNLNSRYLIGHAAGILGAVAYPGIFFGGGSTNSVEDRENGDLGAVAP